MTEKPAGWYPDPSDPDLQRWWGGFSWSDVVRQLPAEMVEDLDIVPAVFLTGHVPAAVTAPSFTSVRVPSRTVFLGTLPRRSRAVGLVFAKRVRGSAVGFATGLRAVAVGSATGVRAVAVGFVTGVRAVAVGFVTGVRASGSAAARAAGALGSQVGRSSRASASAVAMGVRTLSATRPARVPSLTRLDRLASPRFAAVACLAIFAVVGLWWA